MNIINQTIKKLQSNHATTVEEGLFTAREIIEYFVYGEQAIQQFENREEILSSPINQQSIQKLANQLIVIVETGKISHKATAIQHLSKIPNAVDIDYYKKQLKQSLIQLVEKSAMLSSCIIAIDNQGENIISDGSHNVFDINKSVQDARQYLAQNINSIEGNKWVEAQVEKIKSLAARTVNKVTIFDMAFIEDDVNFNHQFKHPLCPFIQVQVLYLHLDKNEIVKFITYQDDFSDFMWGICIDDIQHVSKLEYKSNKESIYRMYESDEFPLGEINSIEIKQSPDGVIVEVLMEINHKKVLLVTGEVHENHDGTISICRDDESILLFLNPEDVNKI